MTYVAIVKQYDTPHPIARPDGYDPWEFRNCCLCKYNDPQPNKSLGRQR